MNVQNVEKGDKETFIIRNLERVIDDSGHDKAAAHINSYHLWLPSQIKPATIPAETGEGPEATPLSEELLAVDGC